MGSIAEKDLDEWVNNVDDVSAQVSDILDGTITDFDEFDRKLELKGRAKQIREEEARVRRVQFFLNGVEGKGESTRYKWWCKRCFVQYVIDLPENKCTRCQQSDKMMSQEERRAELMGKLDDFKGGKVKHQWRKDKWLRWKKSQAMLKKSRHINYKAWEYWEPNTDSDEEGDPIVPRDNPEFLAMEADLKDRRKKQVEKAHTAEKCQERGNQAMKEGDFVGAVEHYEEGIEYKRDRKALWTNKALAELKIFRWHDAVASCNKVIEYSEVFEDGFTRSADACFKAFTRRAVALRALHKWTEALADLDDALTLFPKDKDARDLREKTEAAAKEAEEAQGAQPVGPSAEAAEATPARQARGDGSVRVEIEESDSEAEEEDAVDDGKSLLAGMSKKDFAKLLERLRGEPLERVRFCTRGGGSAVVENRWEGSRKIEFGIEEVGEPSGLDAVLKDAERCSVLWRKSRGPRREDEAIEDKENAAFQRVVAPRALSVLKTLASCSDHHCALTAPAIRHVWPLVAAEPWRHMVLELLLEWSQRSISAKALAEFAGRYPEPNLRLLVEAVTSDAKENILPPSFDRITKEAAERIDAGRGSVDDALEDIFQGLAACSDAELAVSALGNACSAGHANAQFREHMLPFCEPLVAALARMLDPKKSRFGGRAAGALCNLLRLGDAFSGAVADTCTEPLVKALRSEISGAGRPQVPRELQMEAGGLLPVDGAGRVLGALVNLLVVRPAAAQRVLELGALGLVVPLIAPEDTPFLPASDDDGPDAGVSAEMLAARLLAAGPGSAPPAVQDDLVRRLARVIQEGAPAAGQADSQAIERLERAVRMLTILCTKTPGGLDRLTGWAPRVEELPDGAEGVVAQAEAPVAFGALAGDLVKLALKVQPKDYLTPDQEGGPESRLRGNLALLLGALCEAQGRDGAPPALRGLDLSPLVGMWVGALKKERGAAQHNIGVCVTRLAQSDRYRQQVRDFNGIETLHQVQLPKVEASKAKAEKQHRLETSTEYRKRELQRRQQPPA